MNTYISSGKNKSKLRIEDHHFTHLVFNFISSIRGGQQLSLTDEKLDAKVILDRMKHKITVELSFNTTAKEGDQKIFNLSTGYKGVFVYEETTEASSITNFSKINAPAIIYPFFRAAIAGITLAVGVPPLTLPIVNFTKYPVVIQEISS